MKVVIVEDEVAASENLSYLLKALNPEIEILAILDSVKASVKYFSKPHDAKLIFMDIHLADGNSFEIFSQTPLEVPIIFTTAYNQYAIKAFKVNSIDYLLKPIDEDELSVALEKFEAKTQHETSIKMEEVLKSMFTSKLDHKSTYLVHHRDELLPIKTEDIAYFYIDVGVVKAVTFSSKSYIVDKKLEDIEKELNTYQFFRINRQAVVNRAAVENVKVYFNGKLIVGLNPKFPDRVIVSKAKATAFKDWLGR
ncbi:MAG: hypothetical protein BM564_12510 [Bacteroidetes bacterium MedPE-SWsnd-G2]|nr:MAG: hypothetical protein BM564_12510 [Bacteroidetes bacterium MedPE-SWsnd-G2]